MPNPAQPVPDYELIKVIGAGSYGTAWLARSVTGIWRAIKIMKPGPAGSTRLVEREMAGITRFQQALPGEPRQLALLHVGRLEDGGFYYVMELADDAGGAAEVDASTYVPLTLKEMQRRRGAISAREVLRLAIELSRALDGLHRRGLVHRDIKPSNIIFVQGVPKLADVGLVSSSDQVISSVGTRDYLPPEGTGHPAGDIYSLGKVLYELATGQPAMAFPRLPAEAMERPDWPQLRRLNPIILRAAESVPADRPANAAALLAEFEAVPAGGELEILRDRLRRAARRSRLALAVVAVQVLIIAVGAAVFGLRLARQEHRRRILAEKEQQTSRYAADLRLAVNALALADPGGGMAALDRQSNAPADLRGFEWHALRHEFRDDAIQLVPLTNTIPAGLALAFDGSRFATLTLDDRIHWWRSDGSWAGVAQPFSRMAGVDANGMTALALHTNGSWQVVNAAGTATIAPVTGEYPGARWPGDFAVVLRAAEPVTFTVWNFAAGAVVHQFSVGAHWSGLKPFHAALDRGGTRVAAVFVQSAGMDQRYHLGVWRTVDGGELWSRTFEQPVYSPRLSADGEKLAVTDRLAGLAVYEAASGRLLQQLPGHLNRVDALGFSPDGNRLASGGGDRGVRIWDWRNGREISRLLGARQQVTAVGWLPGGRELLAASDEGAVRRFAVPENRVDAPNRPRVYADERFGGMLFNADATLVAVTGTNGTVELLRLPGGTPAGSCSDLFEPLAWDPDGSLVGLGPDWSVRRQRAGEPAFTQVAPPVWLGSEFPEFVTPMSTRGQLAWGDEHGRVGLISTRPQGIRLMTNLHTSYVNGLAFSAVGDLLASGGDDATVVLTDTTTGAERARWKTAGEIQHLLFSPDGQDIIVARRDPVIEVWSVDGRRRAELNSHSRYVYGLAFVDGGERLVSAGADGKLVFWRRPDYRPLAELPFLEVNGTGGDQSPHDLKSAPDGRSLGLMTQDGRLRLWTRP